tara:strand:- start:540 stop:710 length:171 start_codon:yes stop_codon:yes gene_type:complete
MDAPKDQDFDRVKRNDCATAVPQFLFAVVSFICNVFRRNPIFSCDQDMGFDLMPME